MGSTDWIHSYSCCSDKCGLELKEKLYKLHSSNKFFTLLQQRAEIYDELCQMESGIMKGENVRPPYQYKWE